MNTQTIIEFNFSASLKSYNPKLSIIPSYNFPKKRQQK